MRNTTGACFTAWEATLLRIQSATNGTIPSLTPLLRDPWGSPYSLDENEREMSASDCRNDVLRSLGPDGIYGNADDLGIEMGSRWIDLMHSRSCP